MAGTSPAAAPEATGIDGPRVGPPLAPAKFTSTSTFTRPPVVVLTSILLGAVAQQKEALVAALAGAAFQAPSWTSLALP